MDFAWMLWMKDKHDTEPRRVYNIPVTQLQDCPCLFSAYYANEYKEAGSGAVAVDIVYSKAGDNASPLLLYDGKYLVIKKNSKGSYTFIHLNAESQKAGEAVAPRFLTDL